MTRVVRVLLAALVAWLGLVAPVGQANASPTTAVQVHAYEVHHRTATSTTTTSERGPPHATYTYTANDAVDRWSHGTLARPTGPTPRWATTYDDPSAFVQVAWATGTTTRPALRLVGDLSSLARSSVAAKSVDELAEIGFRSDTSHIFRNATGHLAEDTAENRALIKSALDPANLRDTITLKDGTTLQKYFRDLPDGSQAWAEVRNGEITNGGLNVIPR